MAEVKTIYKCDICGKESGTNYMNMALCPACAKEE